jgi:hypothetical protein
MEYLAGPEPLETVFCPKAKISMYYFAFRQIFTYPISMFKERYLTSWNIVPDQNRSRTILHAKGAIE